MPFAAAILVLALQADPPKEVTIQSDIPIYSVTLPAGYEAVKPPENPQRYTRSFGRETWYRTSVSFAHGAGPIPQNPPVLTASQLQPFVALPPDATRTFVTVKWKNLEVGGLEFRAVVKDLPVLGLAVVLPLKGNALTMTVTGPTSMEKEIREEFREILSRIDKTTTNWWTPEELKKMETFDRVGMAGLGLLALYPIVWAVFFRGNPMKAHWVRVLWFLMTALLLFAPISSPGPTTVINNLIMNAVLPLAMLLFVARRIKLGIDEG